MDEFWRKKDLSISGNCPGGPAVTPGGHSLEPPSGHVVTTEVPGHVGSPFPSYPPPFDPTVPPPPLPPALVSAPPPSVPPVVVPTNLTVATQRPNQPDIYSNPPPVIYYPPEPVMPPVMPPPPPLMEDTPEKTQTATNIR